jgi:alkanesulfonate monooxygenase SsuD/methylene tetrahydromethanopterin reductase-like flavin-dependent oxidoreductase (luciferase family)
MASKVRFGLTLSNRGVILGLTKPREILEMAQKAEDSGVFNHVWVGDSIMAKPRMECISLMSAIAACTSRVGIGVACMASLPSRNPIVLAYQWASLDLLSNGRTILGACMGGSIGDQDHRTEYRNMGIKSLERARRMEENIDILRQLWTGERVTFQGEFHTLEDAFVAPKPAQSPPPVWVVSNPRLSTGKPHIIERSLRRVSQMGDGWMTTAIGPVSDFLEMRRRVLEYATEYDRTFEGLPCSVYYNININEDVEAAFDESKRYLDQYYSVNYHPDVVRNWVALGSPDDCIRQIGAYVDAGATDILLRIPSWDQQGQFRRCVEEVLPHFR